MKKILIINALTFCFGPVALFAQGGLLLDNAQIVCNGSIKIVIENGKWKNTGGTFTRGNSTLKLSGNASAANSVIEGDVTTFHDLEIAKSQNNVKILSSTVQVNNNLRFTSKNLDLNGKTVVLGIGLGGGNLSNENSNSYTYSAMPLSSVTKTQSIANPLDRHFGNMGMRITATGSFGNTTLDRRHKAQTLPTGDGIQKYWRLSTTNNPAAQNATLRFQYFDSELNGLNEADLIIYRSIDNGANWTDMGRSSNSTTQNYVEQVGLTDINGWWTLGAPTPLIGPVEERELIQAEKFISPAPPSAWSIFPNPAHDWISVSVIADAQKAMLFELFTLDGKVVFSSLQQALAGENTFRVDIGDLSPGVYLGRIAGTSFQPIRVVK